MDVADLVAIEMDDTRLGLENTIPLRAAKDFCKCITRHIEFRDKQLLTSQRERTEGERVLLVSAMWFGTGFDTLGATRAPSNLLVVTAPGKRGWRSGLRASRLRAAIFGWSTI